jgi:hypothetical protein
MKKLKTWIVRLAFVAIVTLAVLGCSTGSSAPSKAEVGEAFEAMGSAMSSASYDTGPGTYVGPGPYIFTHNFVNPSGGSASVSFTSNTDPYAAGPCSISGSVTFSSWVEPTTGYTISGTLSCSITSTDGLAGGTYPQTLSTTFSCNLTLSGGAISTLSCNISESVTLYNVAPWYAFTIDGTVTANGHVFDMGELSS